MSEQLAQRVVDEMQRQRDKWGEQNHPDSYPMRSTAYRKSEEEYMKKWNDRLDKEGKTNWLTILQEELHEALAALTPEDKVEELVQVAAVALSWADCVQRRTQAT